MRDWVEQQLKAALANLEQHRANYNAAEGAVQAYRLMLAELDRQPHEMPSSDGPLERISYPHRISTTA